VGKPERKTPLGRYRHRCLYDIKMDKKINRIRGCGINLAQDRDKWRVLVEKVMNLRVP
jgi:hypothetical protein